ncbi:uncharacterized protein [Enoplosus armatus]|uniref:uncharacterized protein n=1 Tax=Enoplosus armatus TaxID=215367 RepID=UPI0039946618
MAQVLILLVVLVGVTHAFFPAAETKCCATQNTSLCSVALGGSVYIQVMPNASGHHLRWKKLLPTGSVNVLSLKKEKVTIQEAFINRTQFFTNNGTLKITNVERNDSGLYSVEVFDPNGVLVRDVNVKLDVQETTLPILIIVGSAVGVLLIVVVMACCVCLKVRRKKKSGSGVETYCDGRQDGAQCYGALGGTVVLQLMDNRSSFTPSDGTFRINNLSWTDGGEYTLSIFDSKGKESELRTLQLTIQAPVSSVWLVSGCLSQGEMRASCSSEGGDSPQYSWTLDGHTLTDAQLLSGNNETHNITLKQDVSGRLVCSVSNHISNVSTGETISTCGFIFINCTLPNGTHISQWVLEANNTLCIEPTTTTTTITTEGKESDIMSIKPSTNITSSNQTVTSPRRNGPWFFRNLPTIAGVLSVLVFLLVVGVAVVCAHKKKQNNKPKEEEEGEMELTYADVRVVQRQGRKMQQREEMEVEYGQVKFSQRPRQTVEPTGDECVYAKVRKVT